MDHIGRVVDPAATIASWVTTK